MRAKSRNNGKTPPQLWCVELVPIKEKLGTRERERAVWLARGIPRDPNQALMWMASVFCGLVENGERQFARVGQRLAVFEDRWRASQFAKKEQNEFWSAHVREVRVF